MRRPAAWTHVARCASSVAAVQARALAVLAVVQRARLRDPCVAADAAGKFGQPRVELVDVALAPARDLPIGGDAELVQHPLEHGADADDELQVVGRAGRIEQRRRRIVLDVDDDLPIARRFRRARVGELARAARRRSSAKARSCAKLGERRAARADVAQRAGGSTLASRVPIRRRRGRVRRGGRVKPRSRVRRRLGRAPRDTR